MAKVVGKDESALRRATCRNCASIVEYALHEVGSFTHHDYGGGSEQVYYVVCPNCGYKMQGVKSY